jgi:Plasmid maintenance system antidote protein
MQGEQTSFKPNWASPPGETIKDLLAERDITVASFAENMSMSEEDVILLLNGKTNLNNEIAFKLGYFFNIPSLFWLCREEQYQSSLVRITENNTKAQAMENDANAVAVPHSFEYDEWAQLADDFAKSLTNQIRNAGSDDS